MNFLEPWVFLSSVAGLVAAWLMFRAALTSVRVLRRWDLARATEGQLLLERRLELASTFVRVAFPLSVLSLLLFVLATDKLRQAIRGAMCSYGVLGANDWGFRALFAGVVAVLPGRSVQAAAVRTAAVVAVNRNSPRRDRARSSVIC
jgi:hypothetical protein